MFAAHLAFTSESLNLFNPSSWLEVAHGRSSILFAVLAGVSMAILSGRTRVYEGAELVRCRIRIFVRAAWLFALGSILDTFGSSVAVILEYYAVLFVLALPFLSWRPRRLFIVAGVLAVVMPVLHLVASAWLQYQSGSTLGDILVAGTYPALIWIVFPLVGIGVGRLDLTAARVRALLLAAGVMLAVVGYGLGAATTESFDGDDMPDGVEVTDGADGAGEFDDIDGGFDDDRVPGDQIDVSGMECFDYGDGTYYCEPPGGPSGDWDDDGPDYDDDGFSWSDVDLRALGGAAPHSGTPFEVVGSAGVALGVIALCLMVADRVRWLVFPLAATGAMALTAYCGHVVAIALLEESLWDMSGNQVYLWFVLVTLAVASLWRLTLGRGPLERLLTWSSRRVAGDVSDRAAAATDSPTNPSRS